MHSLEWKVHQNLYGKFLNNRILQQHIDRKHSEEQQGASAVNYLVMKQWRKPCCIAPVSCSEAFTSLWIEGECLYHWWRMRDMFLNVYLLWKSPPYDWVCLSVDVQLGQAAAEGVVSESNGDGLCSVGDGDGDFKQLQRKRESGAKRLRFHQAESDC